MYILYVLLELKFPSFEPLEFELQFFYREECKRTVGAK